MLRGLLEDQRFSTPTPRLAGLKKIGDCTRASYLLGLALWVGLPPSISAEYLLPSTLPQSGRSTFVQGQSPVQKGATEWGWNSGWAGSLAASGVREGDFWSLRFRWGRVLTSARGPSFLQGNLEYVVELVPALVIVQSNTFFGGGITPVLLQYNFTSPRRVVPFVQAGAGMLFTSLEVPQGTSRFNFTPEGGVGLYWFRWPRAAIVFGVRYHHISNAGTAEPNPGRNSIHIHTGISWWR